MMSGKCFNGQDARGLLCRYNQSGASATSKALLMEISQTEFYVDFVFQAQK